MKKSLIVSTCKFKEHELEFVRPIKQIFKECNKEVIVKKYDQKINFKQYDIIVISGTSLLDFDYLNYVDNFEELKNTDKTVIGICAGSQILAKLYSLSLVDQEIIGKKEIQLNNGDKIYGFFLTSKVIRDPKNFTVLGTLKEKKIPVFLKYKNTYLFTFHPEILNKEYLIKIIKQSS